MVDDETDRGHSQIQSSKEGYNVRWPMMVMRFVKIGLKENPDLIL